MWVFTTCTKNNFHTWLLNEGESFFPLPSEHAA